jgi:transcriptional regulator with XRE-family HTH domain
MNIQDIAGATLPMAGQMQTRIREFRKLRGLTLKQLAALVNTTPQTVQRLETENMTVSMDWLQKFADALMVEPADLVSRRSSREIDFVGRVSSAGRVLPMTDHIPSTFRLDAPAEQPIAVRVEVESGPFKAGLILIANRFREEDIENAHGRDCIVQVADGQTLLRRVIRGDGNGWTLVPLDTASDVQYRAQLAWAARIIMAISYY